jgi:hypothetical protein
MADNVSERLYLGRITPGMDVCDVTGEKVGTISHIYRYDAGTQAAAEAPPGDEIIEVKTGFLGFGKHFYIPMGAVQEVLTDSLFLSKSRQMFEELGYDTKPAHMDSLS